MKTGIDKLNHFENLIKLTSKIFDIKNISNDIYLIKSNNNLNKNNSSIAIVALTHGDEIIGLDILIELLYNLLEKKLSLSTDLYLIIANKMAYLKGQRYIENDLNRVYSKQPNCLESKRASVIKEAIEHCDYIVDIHQTIEDTFNPFFILPFNKEQETWIRSISPNIPIVARENVETITTLSTYGFLNQKRAVTFEVGGSGVDLYQLELGFSIIKEFISYASQEKNVVVTNSKERSLSEVYRMSYFHPYSKNDGEVKFHKKFTNFEMIEKEQTIAMVGKKTICSPIEGKILLYPRKWFKEDSNTKPDGIFTILTRI